jgi:post-segregation antitoxin (ccd killing protein)
LTSFIASAIMSSMSAIKASKPDLRTTIDRDLFIELRRLARERGVPMSAILERALDRYLRDVAQGGDRALPQEESRRTA